MCIAANYSWSFVYGVPIFATSCVLLTMCVLLSHILYMPDFWLEISIRKVLRPATSARLFLAFPVSISKC